MKAATRHQYCAPEAITVAQLIKPSPHANEILVKVQATTVNRTDCAILTGKPAIMRAFTGLLKPKNPVTGTDFCGVIEAIGSAVTKFRVGDQVWGFNDEGLGSHAEYVAIKQTEAIALAPSN